MSRAEPRLRDATTPPRAKPARGGTPEQCYVSTVDWSRLGYALAGIDLTSRKSQDQVMKMSRSVQIALLLGLLVLTLAAILVMQSGRAESHPLTETNVRPDLIFARI